MWSFVNSSVNSGFNRLFDVLCWPIAGLPELWQAGLLGGCCGVLLLGVACDNRKSLEWQSSKV